MFDLKEKSYVVLEGSLSRALIMARLFIELTKDNNKLQPIDEDIPL